MHLTALCSGGRSQSLAGCCDRQPAATAEALMRSRYSAYVPRHIDYLKQTTLPIRQPGLDLAAMDAWGRDRLWLGLRLIPSPP